MSLKILCTPDFTEAEKAAIEKTAALLHITPEELVRKAVAYFSALCVPTQGA